MAKQSIINLKRYTRLISYACNTLSIKETGKEEWVLTEEELKFVQKIRKDTLQAKKEGKTLVWETPFDYD
jgi:hypothetical protein